MAIMDNLLTVSSNQAVTITAVSANTIDLLQNRDIGGGVPLFMLFTITAAMLAAGAATVQFDVVTSAATDLSSSTIIGSSGPIPKANLTLGAQIAVALQPVTGLGQRYLGANYTVATGPLTAGTVTAGIVRNVPTNVAKYYPSAFTVA
jgi:hypothetical protein